jgi:magnesium-transporting ATPase (P-type)
MGITGTDVSKEAADLILTNDDFTTVVDAIREGRTLYDNLRKFMTYIFSSNVPEIFPFLISITTHMPLALGLEQVLAIDLGTDVLPALGLGAEPPEPDVMLRQPRRRDRPVVTKGLLRRAFLWLGMIETALCYSGFLLVYFLADRMGIIARSLVNVHPPEGLPFGLEQLQTWSNYDLYRLAVTVFYAGVVLAQVGNAFACRAERNRSSTLGWLRNRMLWVGVILAVFQLLVVVYIPFFAHIFDHRALPWVLWLWVVPFGLILYSLEWIRKAVVRRISHPYERIEPDEAEV